MLLGAGELGKEVIIALQRLGVEVIAVDRYANAPGQQVAHRAHVINMADPAALRALIEAERPAIVVPEIEAIATDALAAVERDGLARISPNRARSAVDDESRRNSPTGSRNAGDCRPRRIASPIRLDELRDAADAIGLPCIVKPVMSSSGKGQSRVDAADQIEAAWRYANAGGRVALGRVIVEGLIDFDYEITLLTVRALGRDGTIETHFCEPIGHVQVAGDYVESWQPQAMAAAALAKARDYAKAVTDDLGGTGIFGVELFVKGDAVWFSEVSPRPHDTGMVTMATQWQNEFELHARAMLGLPVDTSLRNHGASAVIYGGHDARAMRFDGVAEALAVEGTRRQTVRQAGVVRQAAHGRGTRARSVDRRGARASEGVRRRDQATACLSDAALTDQTARLTASTRAIPRMGSSECAVYNAALRAHN